MSVIVVLILDVVSAAAWLPAGHDRTDRSPESTPTGAGSRESGVADLHPDALPHWNADRNTAAFQAPFEWPTANYIVSGSDLDDLLRHYPVAETEVTPPNRLHAGADSNTVGAQQRDPVPNEAMQPVCVTLVPSRDFLHSGPCLCSFTQLDPDQALSFGRTELDVVVDGALRPSRLDPGPASSVPSETELHFFRTSGWSPDRPDSTRGFQLDCLRDNQIGSDVVSAQLQPLDQVPLLLSSTSAGLSAAIFSDIPLLMGAVSPQPTLNLPPSSVNPRPSLRNLLPETSPTHFDPSITGASASASQLLDDADASLHRDSDPPLSIVSPSASPTPRNSPTTEVGYATSPTCHRINQSTILSFGSGSEPADTGLVADLPDDFSDVYAADDSCNSFQIAQRRRDWALRVALALAVWAPDSVDGAAMDKPLPLTGDWDRVLHLPRSRDPDQAGQFAHQQLKAVAQFALKDRNSAKGLLTHKERLSIDCMLICFWLHCDRRLDVFVGRHPSLSLAQFFHDGCSGRRQCDWQIQSSVSRDLRSLNQAWGKTLGGTIAGLLRAWTPDDDDLRQMHTQKELALSKGFRMHVEIDTRSDIPFAVQQMKAIAQLYLDNFSPSATVPRQLRTRSKGSLEALMTCFWVHCRRSARRFCERHSSVPLVTFKDHHCSGKAVCDWREHRQKRERINSKFRTSQSRVRRSAREPNVDFPAPDTPPSNT